MAFTVDLEQVDHREFMVRLNRIIENNNLSPLETKWQSGLMYCFDSEYNTYCYSKELQIAMDEEGKIVPCV